MYSWYLNGWILLKHSRCGALAAYAAKKLSNFMMIACGSPGTLSGIVVVVSCAATTDQSFVVSTAVPNESEGPLTVSSSKRVDLVETTN